VVGRPLQDEAASFLQVVLLRVEVFIQSLVSDYYEGRRYLKIYLSLQRLISVVPFRKG